MSSPPVYDLFFDSDNEDKIAAHGLTVRRVLQVLENEYLIVPNRRRRRAKWLIIGRDNGGGCIAVPIEPTATRGVWRPVTAWPCKDHEEARLE